MNDSSGEIRKLKEDAKRLQERVDSLSQSVAQTKNHPYVVARQVFDSLLLYRGFHASGVGYQEHLQDILGMLRHLGRNDPSNGAFFTGLADLLEHVNKGGPWPGVKQ